MIKSHTRDRILTIFSKSIDKKEGTYLKIEKVSAL